MLQGPGENAGVLDLGDGLAVAFKVESHNHPSAVEPFQGAATGVGGILRDIVAMGARPIALLDGLRFGAPDWHFRRAVAGIGHYGNCVGVPTVGGEAVFDEAYAGNCLVNAMCVGLLETERMVRAAARGVGNVVVLYGATTGRDGIGGASVLASQELGEDAAEKRPSVQIGDPFTGKKLIEVSLELVERGLVESLQDCGAAGLASSLSEMARDGRDRRPPRPRAAARGGDGAVGDHDLREPGADGRDRPARTARRGRGGARPLGAPHAVIGEVTDTGELRALWDGEVVGEIPARFLTDECPRYEVDRLAAARPRAEADPVNLEPKEWIYERYDQLVGSRTVRRPGLDAAVLRLEGNRGLAVSLDGPAEQASSTRARGGLLAVLEAARNVACAGGEPLGFTDCLNFGNPEKPEIGWELAEAIEGIALACEALGVPVVSGNVSLYNETDGRAIPPTPVVGCVGLVPDVRRVPRGWRRGRRDLLLVGRARRSRSPAPSTRRATARSGSRRRSTSREAALVGSRSWRAAPRCSRSSTTSPTAASPSRSPRRRSERVGAELDLADDAARALRRGRRPGDRRLRAGGVDEVGAIRAA